jgi:hypothetical protein
MKQRSITEYVVFTLVIAVVIALLRNPLNRFLNNYGNFFNPVVCSLTWSLNSQDLKRLLYQVCVSTKDNHLTDEEIESLLDIGQKTAKSPFDDFFYVDETMREMRVHYSTGYAVDSYIESLKPKKFVRQDKPVGFFNDVYQPNKYNPEQQVLLEQAQYREYPSDGSKAQSILGPKRELSYVGLKFPYGLNLSKEGG